MKTSGLVTLSLVALLGLASGAFAGRATAATESSNLQYFRDLAETDDYSLGRPVAPKITPDGRSVIFLRSGPRDRVLRLFELSIADGRERELLAPETILKGAEESLSAEEKARRERQRILSKGFTSFQVSEDGARLLVSLSGRLYVFERATQTITPLPGSGWLDPRFSPDGRHVAAAAGGELHVIDLATATERAVTTGATATLSHGTSEFVAQEEMGRNEGYWWSPDSRTLLCQETDESAVEVRYLADPLHPEVVPTRFFYPRVGTPNAVVRLFLVAREGGQRLPVIWDNSRYPYLACVRWAKSGPLTLLVQNREQTEQVLLLADPATGHTHELLRETDPAWLDLDNDAGPVTPLWLKGARQFLWTTERSGRWQVELREASGAFVRTLTPADWTYRSLVGVDEASGTVFVRGSNDPREVQLWTFPLAGGAGRVFTPGRGMQSAKHFDEPKMLVRTLELFDGTYRCEAVSTAGKVLATVRSVAETPARWPGTVLTRTVSPHHPSPAKTHQGDPGELFPP